jgi:vanillin dehydrogenase
MKNFKLWINGCGQDAASGKTLTRIGPWSNQPVSSVPSAGIEEADQAINAAKAAFVEWSQITPAERRDRLIKAAEHLEKNTSQLVEIGVAETGATAEWIGFNVSLAAGSLKEAASMTTQINGSVLSSGMQDGLAMTIKEPYGVVFGIVPWNSPVVLAIRSLAMPLACGNTVILKGSECCPGLHASIGQLLSEAGLGNGIINVLLTTEEDAPEVTKFIIESPDVRHVNFTGSTRVGKVIAGIAATSLTPSLLELGGKNAFIVLKDADLDHAVSGITFGAFMNQGQICISTDRVIVEESVADSLVEKLTEKVRHLKAGHGQALGLLVSEDAAKSISEMVQDAKRKGADIILGGQTEGACMQPTIVDHVTDDMQLYSQEAFGPVVSVIRVKNAADALHVANDTDYGLSAAIYSQNTSLALTLSRKLQCGNCHINGSTLFDEPQIPMGGVKHSGWGRFGGQAAIDEFVQLKTLTIQSGEQFYPF